jgi:hypothetical protein
MAGVNVDGVVNRDRFAAWFGWWLSAAVIRDGEVRRV